MNEENTSLDQYLSSENDILSDPDTLVTSINENEKENSKNEEEQKNQNKDSLSIIRPLLNKMESEKNKQQENNNTQSEPKSESKIVNKKEESTTFDVTEPKVVQIIEKSDVNVENDDNSANDKISDPNESEILSIDSKESKNDNNSSHEEEEIKERNVLLDKKNSNETDSQVQEEESKDKDSLFNFIENKLKQYENEDESTEKEENSKKEEETKNESKEDKTTPKEKPVSDMGSILNKFMSESGSERGITTPRKKEQPKKSVVVRKSKNVPQIPISSPKRKISYKEQQEASARLSMPKQRPVSVVAEQEAKTTRKIKSRDLHDLNSSRRRAATSRNEEKMEVLKAPPEFIEMMKADETLQKQRRISARRMLAFKNLEKNSMHTHEEIVTMTNDIMKGRKKTFDDPATVADIVNELTNRRLQAMKENDYLKANEYRIASDNVKLQFRIRDRENFHREFINDLKHKLEDAKEALKTTEREWKERMKELNSACKEEIEIVKSNQDSKLDKFEEFWSSEEAARKFTKKSPDTLNRLVIEKNMALTGDLLGAHRLQKIIKKAEQVESKQKAQEMQQSMSVNQSNLITQLNTEMSNVLMSHEMLKKQLQMQNEEEVKVAQRRVEILERIIAEESDLNRFCSKKFKRSSDKVVPMTVTINGGDDIPTCGKARAAPRNTNVLMSYRESTVSSPLQLPKLKFKRPKMLLDNIKDEERRRKREEI